MTPTTFFKFHASNISLITLKVSFAVDDCFMHWKAANIFM